MFLLPVPKNCLVFFLNYIFIIVYGKSLLFLMSLGSSIKFYFLFLILLYYNLSLFFFDQLYQRIIPFLVFEKNKNVILILSRFIQFFSFKLFFFNVSPYLLVIDLILITFNVFILLI